MFNSMKQNDENGKETEALIFNFPKENKVDTTSILQNMDRERKILEEKGLTCSSFETETEEEQITQIEKPQLNSLTINLQPGEEIHYLIYYKKLKYSLNSKMLYNSKIWRGLKAWTTYNKEQIQTCDRKKLMNSYIYKVVAGNILKHDVYTCRPEYIKVIEEVNYLEI